MKALVLEAYGTFAYRDAPDPKPSASDEVLVRVKAVGICGSDVHGMDGSTGRRMPPLIMGHEAAGEIAALGGAAAAAGWKVGDRVTFDSTVWCGECVACRSGDVNLCDRRKVLGVSCDEYKLDGAFAEYVVVPARILFRLPEGLSFARAAMAEPVGVAMHAASLPRFKPGDSVAIVGAGLIGLILLKIVRNMTAGKILAVDVDPGRLETALAFGADAAFDARESDVVAKVREAAGGRGVDLAFEVAGATAPIATAIEATRKGGQVVLVGNASPKIELALQSVVTRQISLLGSCAIAGEYPAALELMARGRLDVDPLVSAVAPLSEGAAWFARLYAREKGLFKVILEP